MHSSADLDRIAEEISITTPPIHTNKSKQNNDNNEQEQKIKTERDLEKEKTKEYKNKNGKRKTYQYQNHDHDDIKQTANVNCYMEEEKLNEIEKNVKTNKNSSKRRK
ncbi:hypothetical protein C2G38_2148616 [Gigaspora rosea]|uniref:Uncharacterized protein n=1 Tax=Gigaspora rosea TaxID=44941 RepID=A0A397U961_9GLOM|nr:hypothetical protein C2G38_2148616 [Gigaspora rosea]